tara:strand:- start:567 stop:1031 length:465 start_codon:yes stop_codon:yes gene_type:complete
VDDQIAPIVGVDSLSVRHLLSIDGTIKIRKLVAQTEPYLHMKDDTKVATSLLHRRIMLAVICWKVPNCRIPIPKGFDEIRDANVNGDGGRIGERAIEVHHCDEGPDAVNVALGILLDTGGRDRIAQFSHHFEVGIEFGTFWWHLVVASEGNWQF